jgi:adenylyl cyclase-associated protein
MNAIFDDLNKGSDVTRGLKKVDAAQMTHKNPSLRATAPVPTRSESSSSLRSKSPAPPGKKPKPESMRTKKPPRKELDGNRWIIENFESPTDIVELDAELNHTILISRCKNTTVRINGKANAISLDNSSRTSLIIDSLVSSVDVIKCPNFAIQVIGTLPTILLDQVDGATVYLSKESLKTEIFTSKCSSVNINLPAEDDFTEHALPEQIRSYVQDGQIVSEIVEHAG